MNGFRSVCISLVLLSLGGGGLVLSSEEASRSLFAVRTADGAELRGGIRALDADWSLRLADGGEGSRIAARDVVSARRLGVSLPPMPAGDHLVFANGDRLPLVGLRLEGEKLRGKCPDFGGVDVEIPLGAVAVWWRTAPDGVRASDQFLRRILTADRKRDAVYLVNGDVLEGALDSLNDKQVSLEIDKRLVATDLARVAAVALGNEPAAFARPKGIHARVTIDGGTRLTLASAECPDGLAVRGTTTFGASVRVPLGHIVALDWLGGRTVYLSDLKPSGFDEPLPYLGGDSIRWPPVSDGSVDERDLRVGGSTYAKGIGMHSSGRLRYNLRGAYRRFEAVVGLDDKTGRRGSVRVRVLGDGKPLDIGFTDELTAKNGPIRLQADVTGVQELTLAVDAGRGGNVQDHVDWADARVIQ
jgi:hypothetical protein